MGRGLQNNLSFAYSVLAGIFPQTCAACGRFSTNIICPECYSGINFIGPPICEKCGLPLSGHILAPNLCLSCSKARPAGGAYFDVIRGICLYEGAVKKLISSFKYGKKDFLSKILADVMEKSLTGAALLNQCDYIVPVPLHWKKQFLRGFNQSELLSKRLSDKTGKPVITGILKRIKATSPQTGLSRGARLENVKNAFFAKETAVFNSKNILLIDDVSTTCETLNQCAKALKDSGAAAVCCLTLARDAIS